MLNLLSILIALGSLVIVIPSQIPFLGWGNWVALPVLVVGVVIGALSKSNAGRNLCIAIFILAVLRLSLGGGFI